MSGLFVVGLMLMASGIIVLILVRFTTEHIPLDHKRDPWSPDWPTEDCRRQIFGSDNRNVIIYAEGEKSKQAQAKHCPNRNMQNGFWGFTVSNLEHLLTIFLYLIVQVYLLIGFREINIIPLQMEIKNKAITKNVWTLCTYKSLYFELLFTLGLTLSFITDLLFSPKTFISAIVVQNSMFLGIFRTCRNGLTFWL